MKDMMRVGRHHIKRLQEPDLVVIPICRIGRDDMSGSSRRKESEVGRADEQVTIDILDDSSRQNDGVSF